MSSVVVQFAPSPTGRIHIGNARTALFNWLFARKAKGRFILRFDDTDRARSSEEHARAIELDLAWLGMRPDLVLRQSQRCALYEAAAQALRSEGRLYPCYETAEELERKRRRQIARGLPPIYDRAALALSEAERRELEAQGRRPHWRFRLQERVVTWTDLVRGPSQIDCASLSDPVLVREDGAWLYTLPSVVDDIDLRVTHVIRGEDHVTNTAVQMQIFETLAKDRAPPAFAHHNLLTDASGEGLSKRSGALSIGSLHEAGIEPMAVAALAALTGTSEAVRPLQSLDELAALFDFAHVSRAAARFDPRELAALSARVLHATPFEAVRERLAAHEIVGSKAEPFWLAVRGNLNVLPDALDWWRVVEGVVRPILEDEELLSLACACLPPEPWSANTWSQWTTELRTRANRKGKALYHPLRLALTGRDQGPELAALLPLIGELKAKARLCGRAA